MVGRKPYLSKGPATHATGTPCTTRDRGRPSPMLTVVTTFSFLGSNSRARPPAHPSVRPVFYRWASVPDAHGTEVGPRRVLETDAVQDGELLVIPELLQRRHVMRDAVLRVEVHDLVVGDPDCLPVVAVQRVVIWDHRIQIVVPARELENHYYRVFLRRLGCWHGLPPCLIDTSLRELILSGRDDQLQHLAGALVSELGVGVAVPADLAPRLRLGGQLLLGVVTDYHRTQQVKAPVDQLVWAQIALGFQPVDDGANPGQR